MDNAAWIQTGVLLVSLAGLAVAIIKIVGRQSSDRFDKVDYQFSKVDLKFDEAGRHINEKVGQVTTALDRLRDLSTDRHIANIERLARLEGQITALPQRADPSVDKN
jgi:hypothetical protein